jgi:CHASE3 domain sensor protein
MIMIMNLRPTTPAALNTVVQEMEERFPTDEEQETIVEIIREVLGSPDGESQRKEMEEGASRERERMAERIAKEQEAMEIDE